MQSYAEQKARIARLNLMDDQFFQKVAQNSECCEEILRIILQMPNLKVVSNEIERTIPNVTNKSVKLDLICEDANGNIINVEVQKANDTDHQKRVRYNMASIDTLSAEKGTDYTDLPDMYIIFISAFDIFKQGKTIYHIERTVKETGITVENGTHEIYVNTAVDDGSDIAKLMQYFKNSTGIHPLFEKLSNQVYYYKESPEGVSHVGNVWEEYADEVAAKRVAEKVTESHKEMAVALMKKKIMSLAEIAELTKLPLEEVEALAKAI